MELAAEVRVVEVWGWAVAVGMMVGLEANLEVVVMGSEGGMEVVRMGAVMVRGEMEQLRWLGSPA